jgi:hypothetical protein
MKRFLQKNSKRLQSFKKFSEHTKIMKARSEKFEAFLNLAMPGKKNMAT